jgi:hypothetical protein
MTARLARHGVTMLSNIDRIAGRINAVAPGQRDIDKAMWRMASALLVLGTNHLAVRRPDFCLAAITGRTVRS